MKKDNDGFIDLTKEEVDLLDLIDTTIGKKPYFVKYLKSRLQNYYKGLMDEGEYWKINSIWRNLKDRCNNPNNPNYPNYGGRGIMVCSQWYEFTFFLLDMGPRPEPSKDYILGRINRDGNYCPDNCRWVLKKDSYRLRSTFLKNTKYGRIEYKDQIKSAIDWSKELGISCFTIKKHCIRYDGVKQYLDEDKVMEFLVENKLNFIKSFKIEDKRREKNRLARNSLKKCDFEKLLRSLVFGKRFFGLKFRFYAPLFDIEERECIATLYCHKYSFIVEPLRGIYTEELYNHDKFLLSKGYYVFRVRETNDSKIIYKSLVYIKGKDKNFSLWKKDLRLFLSKPYEQGMKELWLDKINKSII